MQLSKHIVAPLSGAGAPPEAYFNLPEKVLQFGTGVLLRGLPDYYIDKANKEGIFNGRIVVVKSTGSDVSEFDRQDCLYTHNICGIEKGAPVNYTVINAAISRVLPAATQWEAVLQCAENEQLQIVISNTTEVGIALIEEDIHAAPPASFPGKLLAFLYRRFTAFNGAADKGLVIIPTELIVDNGTKLKDILLQLAYFNKLDDSFVNWLQQCNHFCSSLVDRIVPGKLTMAEKDALEKSLGYTDDLMITSEPYSLWAIETADDKVKAILSFYKANDSIVIAPDITIYRELKLRLLNGAHTFSCGLAYLAGFDTVNAAMDNAGFARFIQALMQDEITPAITGNALSADAAAHFSAAVLDRFRNPYIGHKWLNITLQYSSKMAMRNIPVIVSYIQRLTKAPLHMALGFAAHILFMQCSEADGKYYGSRNGETYPVNDDNAAFYAAAWQQQDTNAVVKTILGNTALWKTDLTTLNGFANTVTGFLNRLINDGAMAVIQQLPAAN